MSEPTTTPPEPAAVAMFTERILALFNQAGLAIMMGVGHATGLFDTLAALPAASSAEIAEAAGLQERYVREWLSALAAGRVVEYDPAAETFRLPPAHAAVLTRAAGASNLAAGNRVITALGMAEPDVLAAFRTGAPVPPAAYARYEEQLAGVNALAQDANLVPAVLPLAPGLSERLEAGIEAADIGCGRGHVVALLATAFPRSRITGYDLSERAVAAARAEAERLGLPNARFERRDAATLDAPGRYALITAFDSIHDQGRPEEALRRIHAALAPDGVFLMAEIAAASSLAENLAHPMAPLAYAVSTLYCVPTSLAQGGEGLGAMWGERRAREFLAAAGFRDVAVRQPPGEMLNRYFLARRA